MPGRPSLRLPAPGYPPGLVRGRPPGLRTAASAAAAAAYVAATAWSHHASGGAAAAPLGLLVAWAVFAGLLAGLLRAPRRTWVLAAGASLGQLVVHVLLSTAPFAASGGTMGAGMPPGMPMPSGPEGAWAWQMWAGHAALAALAAATLAHGQHVLARVLDVYRSTLERLPLRAFALAPLAIPEPARLRAEEPEATLCRSEHVPFCPRRGPPLTTHTSVRRRQGDGPLVPQ